MATALQEARERLASTREKWAKFKADRAAATTARAAIATKSLRRRKPLTKRIALVLRPGEQHEFTTLDLRPHYLEYVAGAKEAMTLSSKKRAARLLELAIAGQIKINPPGGGNGIGAQGLAAKIRIVDAAAIKRIKAADAKATRAENAARKARAEWRDLKALEWANGTKMTRDEIAAIVAAAADEQVQSMALPNPYFDERTANDEIEDAETHLAHVKSKSKEPCPCRLDARARNNAQWEASQRERAAKEAQREADREKAIRKAPKVRFLCPTCDLESIAPVLGEGEVVDCQNEDCGATLTLAALRTQRVAKSELPQVLYGNEDEAAA